MTRMKKALYEVIGIGWAEEILFRIDVVAYSPVHARVILDNRFSEYGLVHTFDDCKRVKVKHVGKLVNKRLYEDIEIGLKDIIYCAEDALDRFRDLSDKEPDEAAYQVDFIASRVREITDLVTFLTDDLVEVHSALCNNGLEE